MYYAMNNPGQRFMVGFEGPISGTTASQALFPTIPDEVVVTTLTVLSGNLKITFDGKTTPDSTHGHYYPTNAIAPYSLCLSKIELEKILAIGDGNWTGYYTCWVPA